MGTENAAGHQRIPTIPRYFLIMFVPILIASLITAVDLKAETATEDEMTRVCLNWLTHIVDQSGGWAGFQYPYIENAQDILAGDTVVGRFFEIYPTGYVVVPILKELAPVKAYSDENSLDIYESDGFALMLRQVLQSRIQLYVDVYGSVDASQPRGEQPLYDLSNRSRWDIFAVPPEKFQSSSAKDIMTPMEGIGPLLTTAWHQGSPYNNYCPMGDGGRCVVGCVATAAAQIVYYHRWPPEGEGSKSYYWHGDNSCGGSTPAQTLTADFSDPYAYDDSPDAVAELSCEMGVAFRMDYGVCGSGAYTMDGATVFPTYFRYDDAAHAEYRSDYSPGAWFNMVKSNIDKGRPILYRINLHAIVCDGWRISGGLNQYHFNYGWGGGNNAWYTLDQLYCPWDGCNPMVEAMVVDLIPLSARPWLVSGDFMDNAGDGDGIPEPGETIEMTVTIANFGGAAVTDVMLDLSIDDASLILINDYSHLGTIEAGDSATNIADPFVFEIPADYIARTDSFVCAVTWNGGVNIDTLIIVESIGGTSILVVDDDQNDLVNFYFEECLQNMRIPYDVWDQTASLAPDSAYMAAYDIVIWLTGDYQSYPLSSDDIASLGAYMNHGGNLFLTGQAIAAELSGVDPDFLHDYLRAAYESSQPIMSVPVLDADSGCLVFDGTESISITGGDGAGNQMFPDLIAPLNGSITELTYPSLGDCGGISYRGDYGLVFFSFGFEAIVSNNSRWQSRDSTMADILAYFDYMRPGAAPTATVLAVDAADPMHLVDHVPEFSWSYFDHEGAPQSMYHLQLSSAGNWAVCDMWDTGPIAGNDMSATYDGLPLEDGVRYYCRVRVFDGTYWSDWTQLSIRMNSVPGPPTGLTPDAMTGVTVDAPILTHVNSVDGESDALTYSYEVYADPGMTVPIEQESGWPGGTGWQMTITLTEDSAYFWRAMGSDAYEDGPWSELAAFWVNAQNHAPDPYDLLYPVNGCTLTNRTPEFEWAPGTDADPYDHVTYILFYDTDPAMGTPVTVADLEATEYSPPDPLDFGTVYYWKIRADDAFSGRTYSGQIFSFTTISRGDANGDESINIADAIFIINYIFTQGPPPDPVIAGDSNCDGWPTIADAVYLVNYIFKSGPPPGCD